MSPFALQSWPLVGRRLHVDSFASAVGDDAVHGFVIHGAAGVGKTRLADSCRDLAVEDGFATIRIIATRSSATVPLGAVAPLLPSNVLAADDRGENHGDGATNPAFAEIGLVAQVQARLDEITRASATNGKTRPVVMVDDLQLLDAASATLLHQLATAGMIFLLATVRAGVSTDLVRSLWRDPRIHTIELDSLRRADVDTLLHLALGGPLEGVAGSQLWEISQGNVLYLRELTMGALTSEALVDDGGVWRLRGRLTSTNRLQELVVERIDSVDPDARTVLERLALCQPIGLAQLEIDTRLDLLESLETAGLIRIDVDQRRQQVFLAHTIHAEILRDTMPRLRARQIVRAAAARVDALGARRRDDPVRVAVWRLDGEGRADARLLIAAAAIARRDTDFETVARLAAAALLEDPRSREAGVLVGRAMFELGSFAEAEAAFAVASAEAAAPVLSAAAAAGSNPTGGARPDDEQDLTGDIEFDAVADDARLRLQATVERVRNMLFGLLDPDAAFALNAAALEQLPAADAQLRLQLDQPILHLYAGHPGRALERLEELGPFDEPEQRTWRVVRAIAAAPALTFAGRTSEAIATSVLAYEEHMASGDPLIVAGAATHVIAQIQALTEAGRFNEAVQLGEAAYEISVAARVATGQIWCALSLGVVTSYQGRMATALGWYREAAARSRSTTFIGPRLLATSGLAVTASHLGDAAAALAAEAELHTIAGEFRFLRDERERGPAWVRVVSGDPRGATEILLRHAPLARDAGFLTSASLLWHDAMRIDPTIDVASDLEAIAAAGDSPLLEARARHARAIASRSTEGLLAAGEAFEALGSNLHAAEALLAAADGRRREGDQRGANALTARGEALLERCEGARPQGVVRASTIVPLSDREREVATLAVQGITSKDIADRLYLSVRTVNNHLQRVYTKLGVTSRAELGEALGSTEGRP